jgi:hypothetical protein
MPVMTSDSESFASGGTAALGGISIFEVAATVAVKAQRALQK